MIAEAKARGENLKKGGPREEFNFHSTKIGKTRRSRRGIQQVTQEEGKTAPKKDLSARGKKVIKGVGK